MTTVRAGAAPTTRCNTSHVPTSRPRHTITETDEIVEALKAAALRWPEDAASRSRLIRRLVVEGGQSLNAETDPAQIRRRIAVELTSGMLTGHIPPGHLQALRDEWPE
jgi:hypothetical protein